MKRIFLLFILLIPLLPGCKFRGGRPGPAPVPDEDTTVLSVLERFPDTVYASVGALKWEKVAEDTLFDERLQYLTDPYDPLDGTYTFRGNQRRDMPVRGRVSGTPSRIVKVWSFATDIDTTRTVMGVWGGGTGWTGQPAYVHWSDSLCAAFRAASPGLTKAFSGREIIVGSLCRMVYFLDYDSGEPSRGSIDAGNTIKGSVSVDPEFANLYVGHGVPANEPFGSVTIDLFRHEVTHAVGRDRSAWRGWGGNDGCPVVAGGYLFRCGENGTVYKFAREQGALRLVSRLRFRESALSAAAGMESSLAVCRNYGFIGDNRGNILCINLDTMTPVWRYDNRDDTDGTIVIEEAGGVPYLYSCTEVDRQGDKGLSRFVKLNGLTGEKVWETIFSCGRASMGSEVFDGGMYATPLLGHGDCEDLLFTHISDNSPAFHGQTIALRRSTGEIVWTHELLRYAWSSPAGFYNEEGKLFLFVADCQGNVYLLDGLSGERLFSEKIGDNFESSPVVVDDCVVLGSRGRWIYRLRVE